VRCNVCGLIYSNPILPVEKIERLYRKSHFTYDEHVKNLNETYGHYLSLLSEQVPSKNRLLEIGCGNGFFLDHAKILGYRETYGIEPSEHAVAEHSPSSSRKIIQDFFKPNLFPSGFFDLICSFQTLDHLLDPNTMIRESHHILKREGLVLIIVHDASSLLSRILGERSPIFDIEHIYLFDKKTLPSIFEKHGFRVMGVFSVQNRHALGYWLSLFPFSPPIKQSLFWLMRKTGFYHFPLWLKAGNIALVAKK